MAPVAPVLLTDALLGTTVPVVDGEDLVEVELEALELAGTAVGLLVFFKAQERPAVVVVVVATIG